MTLSKSEVVRNITYIGLGDGISRVLSLIAFAYFARILGPTKLGLVGFAGATIALLFPIVDYGLGFVGTREVSKEPASFMRYVVGIILSRSFLAIVALAGYFAGVLLFFQDAEKMEILTLYSLTLIPAAMSLSWAYQAMRQTWWFAIEKILQSVLLIAGALMFVAHERDYLAIPLIAFVSTMLPASIVMLYYAKAQWKAPLTIDLRFCIQLLKSSFRLFLLTILTQLNFTIAMIVIAMFGSMQDAGIFSVASKVAIFMIAVPNLLWSSFYPVLSRFSPSVETTNHIGIVLYKYAILIGTPVLVLGLAFSTEILETIFGLQYQEAVFPFKLFSVFAFVQFTSVILTRILPALGMERAFNRIVISGAVAQILLSFPLFFIYGVSGVAISFLVSETFVAVTAIRTLQDTMRFRIGRTLLQAIGLMALSSAVVAAFRVLLPISIIPLVALIVGFYAILLFFFSIAVPEDFRFRTDAAGYHHEENSN